MSAVVAGDSTCWVGRVTSLLRDIGKDGRGECREGTSGSALHTHALPPPPPPPPDLRLWHWQCGVAAAEVAGIFPVSLDWLCPKKKREGGGELTKKNFR